MTVVPTAFQQISNEFCWQFYNSLSPIQLLFLWFGVIMDNLKVTGGGWNLEGLSSAVLKLCFERKDLKFSDFNYKLLSHHLKYNKVTSDVHYCHGNASVLEHLLEYLVWCYKFCMRFYSYRDIACFGKLEVIRTVLSYGF